MTTQEKTAAIRKIVANRQDNRDAVGAANVDPLIIELVNDAVNEAFKTDLVEVFVGTPATKTNKG